MLARHRRYFAVLAFLLLAAPVAIGLVAPDGPAAILKEKRRPAPPPALPISLASLTAFPAEADAWLKDNFGLREKMIRLHKDLTKPVWSGVSSVAVTGASGRLYALLDNMVAQSAGHVVRPAKVAEAADMLAGMNAALAQRGIKFLVAIPPNSSTVYQEDLPSWARNPGRPTEYDLLLKDLAARGVKAIDLRPTLEAATAAGQTYLLNDVHWNIRGAVAGFNGVAEADGHPDWRIDPATALGALGERPGGDIATMAGVADKATERTESLALRPVGTQHDLPSGGERRIEGAQDMADHEIDTGRPGPTIMVIGDSFTVTDFPVFLSQHVGKAVWIHHNYCGLDWAVIDRVRPDEVWWAPVERFLVCRPGQHPKNFPDGEVGIAKPVNPN
jgi:alginate O-acetyltransferase complex protein AlgJ